VNLYALENEEINPGGGEFGFLGYTSADREAIGFIYNFGPVFAVSPSIALYQEEEAVKSYYGALEFQWHYRINNDYSLYTGISTAYSYSYESIIVSGGSYKSTEHDYTGKLLFGARYMFNTRLAVFANFGVSYTLQNDIFEEFNTSGNRISASDKWKEKGETEAAQLGVIFYIVR
jgi:hypothetical protein